MKKEAWGGCSPCNVARILCEMEDEVELIASRDAPENELEKDDSRRRNIIPLIWKESCFCMVAAHAVMIAIAVLAPDAGRPSGFTNAKDFHYDLNWMAVTLFSGTIFRSLVGFIFVSEKQRPIP